MKRAALSEPSLSMAPPSWAGLLATMPTVRPSMRISVVTMVRPKSRLISSVEPSSASVSMTLRMSYTRNRFSGTMARMRRWSGAVQSATRPWK